MTMTAEERKTRNQALARLFVQIKEKNFTAGDLDDLVHDAKSEEASDINNQGIESQVQYLVDSWGWKEAVKAIRETLGLPITRVVIDANDQNIKCQNCGKAEPVPFPMEVMAFVRWSETWTKPHEEGACLKESAGGGSSPSTGPSSSSTSS